MSDTKSRMVDGAMSLLSRRGLIGTSFSELLAVTGAPRGSLYHYFPSGKADLIAQAVERAGAFLETAMQPAAGQPATAVVERFLAVWRSVLTQSNCEAGCAVLAVTVGSDSDATLSQARSVFTRWRSRLSGLLTDGGLSKEAAENFALLLIASVEGAVVLSRARQTIEPFDAVAAELKAYLVNIQSSGR